MNEIKVCAPIPPDPTETYSEAYTRHFARQEKELVEMREAVAAAPDWLKKLSRAEAEKLRIWF